MKNKAVFLDRDGTIIEDVGYSPCDFRIGFGVTNKYSVRHYTLLVVGRSCLTVGFTRVAAACESLRCKAP